ncbi:Putative uncharacterized protein [Taphrina deformans PYCC 5710]|uniref:Golgi apparatus membrane protein TVP38 n=1 Tax=Taphrina deformans (strain PYCC 5710 / ATCC 11124 / CBS 356.35 / IMI 108563 / JCM 9778 / NBRC 8474) TaxID=1097556 RepID=R4X9E4_TAPDE|nr:Putative uncharacterized protein [Taphrina deformans PYCC 5710]|eukprot:CCG80829.1 Putative uncharacterized protein [Taphrina deformans PYCC 5710]
MTISRRELQDLIRKQTTAALRHANSLSTVQRLFAASFLVMVAVFTGLSIGYHSALFGLIEGWKGRLTGSRFGWMVLAGVTAVVCFPPLVGYATSVTVAGYVFGFLEGWAVSVVGTVVGASVAFLVYRHGLSRYAARLGAQNRNFLALTRAMDGHGGLTLLILVRACPLPFSLSNAALAAVPSVTFPRFLLATTLGTVRLLVHTFVGSRIADLASGPGQDNRSKVVNALGIVGGLSVGVLTGVVVYRRTKAIANRLAEANGSEEDGQPVGFDSDHILADDEDDGDPTTPARERASLLG